MTTKQDMPELKPCPFCGLSGQIIQHLDNDDRIVQVNVKCKPCGYTLPQKKWNTRTDTVQAKGTRIDIHILLDAVAEAARGEPLDPELCQTIETIARDHEYMDFTDEDIQGLYDCGRMKAKLAAAEGLVGVLREACKVMIEAEQFISDLDLHEKWHDENRPHGAYHDLFFKRVRAEEALAAYEGVE